MMAHHSIAIEGVAELQAQGEQAPPAAERTQMRLQTWGYAAWIILICGFAVLHALHLGADFPNNTPWMDDFAKYTDEGWWGNAAVRAHVSGDWRVAGDFNPAAAVPVWPFLEWAVFRVTGVGIEAARGLAIAFFFANLLLSYLLLRARGSRWMAMLAVTLLVTSPFLYCFSRLAILEPSLITFTLAALNLAVRLPRFKRRVWAAILVGVLFTLMMLTKTSAVFLLPAIGWAVIAPLWKRRQGSAATGLGRRGSRKVALRCALAAACSSAATFGLWMALIIRFGLLRDYQYLFVVNKYAKPAESYWVLLSFWWSLRGALWAGRFLIPLAGAVAVVAMVAWRTRWSRALRSDPVFCSSLLAAAGYILFMTYQNHPQPRYYAVVAFFAFFALAIGIEATLAMTSRQVLSFPTLGTKTNPRRRWGTRADGWVGLSLLAATVIAAWLNAGQTIAFSLNPEYTFVPAVQKLTRYIDQHPNGNRLLLSTSGDQITMVTHLPTICDDFGTQDLVSKLGAYQPGWFATWNEVDPGTLEDLHSRYSLEQVAIFHAFDSPDRNMLVLFKLHPLPSGQVRTPDAQNLQVALPGDKIEVPIG